MTDNTASVVTTTTTTSDLQIRHSGKVHIRGRIRRVWRPRYLELLENGQLRYYEQQRAVVVFRKCTLAVYSARILDMTTLRDLHVGLPRGCFGFLVRGQRIIETSASAASDNDENSTTAASVDRQHRRESAITVANVLLNAAEESQQQPVRDYLCAVDTLEEAQMWVVALQWAASLHPADAEHQQWWKVDFTSTTAERQQTPAATTKKQIPVLAAVSSKKKGAIEKSPQQQRQEPQQQQQGKVLVSKVVGYTVVRISGAFNFEIAYEIHAMLLGPHHQSDDDHAVTTVAAEQWIVLRTAADLKRVMEQLEQNDERQSANSTSSSNSKVLERIAQWKDRPTVMDIERSVSVMDSVLRSWVLAAEIVNARPVKEFLGLLAPPPPQQQSAWWWSTHNGSSVLKQIQETVPSSVTNDQYVKQWLSQRRHQQHRHQKSSTLWNTITKNNYWQNRIIQWRHDHQQAPIVWLGGIFAATSVLPIVLRRMPSVSVRLDVLVVSWMGAACFGRYYYYYSATATATSIGQQQDRKHPKSSRKVISHESTAPRVHKTPRRKHREEEKTSAGASAPANEKSHGDDSPVLVQDDTDNIITDYGDEDDDDDEFMSTGSREVLDEESDGEESGVSEGDDYAAESMLSSPLPKYPDNDGASCWSRPTDDVFYVRGSNYFNDKVKIASGAAPLKCRGVDIWMTDNPQRHIARHPAVLGGKLGEKDTFLVNFLLPFGNFVAYFEIPPLHKFPDKLRTVWSKFLKGDQQYRDARLKLLPYVVEGPWIVKTAVGPGKSPALLGKVIPLQYFFRDPDASNKRSKGVYEVDVIITASSIAKGILSVVKSQTNAVTIAFAFIIEAAEQCELPETVLCSCQIHSVHLEDCPVLPECDLDEMES